MTLDWDAIEETLFTLSRDHLQEFLKTHRDETFYGFCIDCNSTYGGVCLAMNTPELLTQEAQRCIQDHRAYVGKKLQEVEDELRWEVSAWGYYDVSKTETWDRDWKPIYEMISKLTSEQPDSAYDDGTDIEEAFMQMACRVLLKLETDEPFESMRKSTDFRAICLDHDEELWVGEGRLEFVRQSLGGL